MNQTSLCHPGICSLEGETNTESNESGQVENW